jgi:uncharacterized protein with PQ loop repeat
MQIPQILKITSSRSAHGLSLASFILETLAYAITLAYSARSNFPFSTYGPSPSPPNLYPRRSELIHFVCVLT